MEKYLIIDERMRVCEKEKLEQLGYSLVEIKKSNQVYEEISSHVDIFACKIGEKLVIEPNQYELIKQKLPQGYCVSEGQEEIQKEYPGDIKYNVCVIGKKALHAFKNTEPLIKQELEKENYKLINTSQGYTNCSIAVIDDNSAIVTDKGLYKILTKHNIDVLYLNYQPDIKLLQGQEYSNKNGFIGGAISRISDKVIVTGDLDKIDKDNIIREFIEKRNLEIIDFKGLDVIDYGGILEIWKGLKCHKQ